MPVPKGYRSGIEEQGVGYRAACTPWSYARRVIRQPVSFEAGFFDSKKGGETYVDYLG
jgi:hypothetical protein